MAEKISQKEIEEGKFFAVISYIGFFCVVSLVLKKDNKFALYHAKQGLVLFVFEVMSFIISVMPILGWLIRIFGVPIFVLVSLWGMLQAFIGNYNRFFLMSNIADKIVI